MSEEIKQSNPIKTITRFGIARTKHGDKFIIDENAIVIDNTLKIPKESLGKMIATQMFQYVEQVEDHDEKAKVLKNKVIEATEIKFESFCIANNVKYKSKTYYKYQAIYFNGAIAVLDEVPAKWGVSIMSNREIIEDYSKGK